MPFQVTDRVRMIKKPYSVDTYGISPSIIRRHRNTIFKIRKVHEDETGQYALRFYGTGKDNGLRLAYWNPEMFRKVEDEYEKGNRTFHKRGFLNI